MDFEEYEKKQFALYERFAGVVEGILLDAIKDTLGLPVPQTQSRAKTPKSLRRRLREANKLDTTVLEQERRDLAGVRLIFYTNNDVEKFLNSSIVYENFEIEEGSAKIHHPIPENDETQYRGIHYTISLRKNRTSLPEYQRYAGLRCEIQVQTILNHAWSETSHDIIYKGENEGAIGLEAEKKIKERFLRIMKDYLVPAGYELQKAQQEFEQLAKGRDFAERGIVEQLSEAKNNNERYDILIKIRDYVIPYYDHPEEFVAQLYGVLWEVVKTSIKSATVPIETPNGVFKGHDSKSVIRLVIELIDKSRFIDVAKAFSLLAEIFKLATDEQTHKQILKSVKSLSEYRIDIVQKYGPAVQKTLLDHVENMDSAGIKDIFPLALEVWSNALRSQMSSTKWAAQTVAFSKAEVPVTNQILEIRAKAIQALFDVFDQCEDNDRKKEIVCALDNATRVPSGLNYTNELLSITLSDAQKIVRFLIEKAASQHYSLLQSWEHSFFHDYTRVQAIIEDPEGGFSCKKEAQELADAIICFRDEVNDDPNFVRYKLLVGYNSIFPQHWEKGDFAYEEEEAFRTKSAMKYVQDISDENETDWFDLIEICASTKSTDLATFPRFGEFLRNLSAEKPEISSKMLQKASEELRRFLPAFLNGMSLSDRLEIYQSVLDNELTEAKDLFALAKHYRHAKIENVDFATRLLQRSIETENSIAVNGCVPCVIDNWESGKFADSEAFLRTSLEFLNIRQDARWINEVALSDATKVFFAKVDADLVRSVLRNLLNLKHLNFNAQQIIFKFAERSPQEVFEFLGDRCTRANEKTGDLDKYEAIPFELYGTVDGLAKDPELALQVGFRWYQQQGSMFEFQGGRLLKHIFSDADERFFTAVSDCVREGDNEKIDFVLALLKNYQGNGSIHAILRDIVAKCSIDQVKMNKVRICIDVTGVVRGEYGFADAQRERQDLLKRWLEDERDQVVEFATIHISELGVLIADEHRRADARHALRKLEYDVDGIILED